MTTVHSDFPAASTQYRMLHSNQMTTVHSDFVAANTKYRPTKKMLQNGKLKICKQKW